MHTSGEWFVKGAEKEAKGMQASEDMKFHAISAPMDKKASTTDGTLVVQFTVKHEKKDYAFCGGGWSGFLPTGSFGGQLTTRTFSLLCIYSLPSLACLVSLASI